jgi:hypothetical protein
MKALAKYLKKREDTIESLLKKPARKYTPDTFHALRIKIKKLNALSGLIKFGVRDFKKKNIQTIHPFFGVFFLKIQI